MARRTHGSAPRAAHAGSAARICRCSGAASALGDGPVGSMGGGRQGSGVLDDAPRVGGEVDRVGGEWDGARPRTARPKPGSAPAPAPAATTVTATASLLAVAVALAATPAAAPAAAATPTASVCVGGGP